MNRFVFSFLFVAFIIPLTTNQTSGQSLAEADTIRFTLSENSEFLPGEAGMPDELKVMLDSVNVDKRDFDRLLVVGTYDHMGWNPESCDVPGNIPLQKDYQTRQDQCDAAVARWRAITSAQYMIDQRWVDPFKVEPRLLLDERERGIVLIFTNDQTQERIASLERKMEQLDRGNLAEIENRLKQLKKWFNDLEQRVSQNEAAIADLESADARQNERIDSLSTAVSEIESSGTEFGVFIGVGGQYFADQPAGFAEIGLRVGSIELSGSYNINPAIEKVELEGIGETDIGRSGYRSAITWYPGFLSTDRIEFGPQAAFEHGENFPKEKEEVFTTVFEAVQAGLAVNANLWKGLYVNAELGYAGTNTAEATGDRALEFQDTAGAPVYGRFSFRWRF